MDASRLNHRPPPGERILRTLGLLLAVSSLACGSRKEESPPDAQLVFYSLPGCTYCAKITDVVHRLDREEKDRVGSRIENATTPENRKQVQEAYGFASHGLVILDGAGEVRAKLDGHLLTEPQIREALEGVLAESEGGS